MARYVYDENKVNEALDTLKNATKKLSTTASGFSSALSEIASASKGYLWIDTQTLPAIPDQVTSTIEEIMSDITAKQTAIEEYDASPWYEKIFGSTGMIFTKIGEGLGTAGEQLLDGAFTIVGFGVGLFSSEMQSSISEFIEKDHVGDFFYEQYESGALQWINDKSFFSHTSTAANVFKGVGVAAGYVLAAAATGGIGGIGGSGIAAGAASGVSSIGVNTVVAGIGGVGSGTQSGLQNNLSFNEAALQGLKQGAIQAGTVFVAGKLADKLSSNLSSKSPSIADKGDDVLSSTSKTTTSSDKTFSQKISDIRESASQKYLNKTSDKIEDAYNAGKLTDEQYASKMGDAYSKADKIAGKGSKPLSEKISDIRESASQKYLNKTSDKIEDAYNAGKLTDEQYASKMGDAYSKADKIAGKGSKPLSEKISDIRESASQKYLNKASDKIEDAYSAGKLTDEQYANKLGNAYSNADAIANGKLSTGLKAVGSTALNGGKAVVSAAPAATGNLLASGANQSIAQNANAQFKVEMDPSNHVELNTDTPDTVVELIETPDTTPSPAPTDNTASSGSEPVADTVAPTNNSTGNQATTYENASSGTYSNAGTIKTTGSNTSSSIQFRTETPVQSTTTPNNSVSTPEINTPTQTVPDTGNNPTMPDSNTGNGGSNTGSNTDTTVPGGSTTTPTVPETPSTNPGDGISGGITTPEEPVPGTPNPNPPTDNVGGNITDIADNITGGTGGSTTGNYNNYGSSYGNSIIGGLNNNGSQLGPEGELSYENKPDSGILDGNDSINTIDKGNSLDVISIDKDTPKNPSTSSGGSSVIPTILGVGAAGAAGVAGIHYVQKKFGKDNEYYEDESSEENNDNNGEYNVSTNDSINISDEPTGMIEEIPKYKAGGINQLKLDDGADVKINDNNNIIAPQAQEELE